MTTNLLIWGYRLRTQTTLTINLTNVYRSTHLPNMYNFIARVGKFYHHCSNSEDTIYLFVKEIKYMQILVASSKFRTHFSI